MLRENLPPDDDEREEPDTRPRTVLLVRHATADSPPATSDRERPLSRHGHAEAATLGRWLAAQVDAGRWDPVTAVLCSPARRTRQTLQGLAVDAPVSIVEELYGGDVPDVLDALGRLGPTAGTVLIVGHAPGIPATAIDLDALAARSASAPDRRPVLHRFPPASLAALRGPAEWSRWGELGAPLIDVRHP